MNWNLPDPRLMAFVAALIVVLAPVAWLYARKRMRTTANMRTRFDPEYDRAVLTHGSERNAEAKLADREKRVEMLNIPDLDPTEHERFSKRWEAVQTRFVDCPKGAVAEAHDLVSSLMKAPIPSPISINLLRIFPSTILVSCNMCATARQKPLHRGRSATRVVVRGSECE